MEKVENEKVTIIMKHFDNIWETKVKEHIKLDIPLLQALYDKFRFDLFQTIPDYKDLIKKQTDIGNTLYDSLTEEQKNMWNEHWELSSEIGSLESEQLFYFGFLMAQELNKESKIE